VVPLGEFLKRERERKRISLKQVSQHTKITMHYLKYLEENQWDKLPSRTYGKGYLRIYCRYLGLDYKKILLNGIHVTIFMKLTT